MLLPSMIERLQNDRRLGTLVCLPCLLCLLGTLLMGRTTAQTSSANQANQAKQANQGAQKTQQDRVEKNQKAPEVPSLGTSGFVDSSGVKIHFVTQGKGPLCVLLHGFPDFHYSWKRQIPMLARHFQVVALDLRGYNRSDQPTQVSDYTMEKLVGDVDAVLKHFKKDKAVVIGHDWGGGIAWTYAMTHPSKTERLVVLNCPHPRGLHRELANNPQQQKNSAYARALQEEGAEKLIPVAALTEWVKDPVERKVYLEALKRSSMAGMTAYYKANYPRPPYKEERKFPQVQSPTLIIHGLGDIYLLPGALNDTWRWIDNEVTIVTIPEVGHWVHHEAPDRVNTHLERWLLTPMPKSSESGKKAN